MTRCFLRILPALIVHDEYWSRIASFLLGLSRLGACQLPRHVRHSVLCLKPSHSPWPWTLNGQRRACPWGRWRSPGRRRWARSQPLRPMCRGLQSSCRILAAGRTDVSKDCYFLKIDLTWGATLWVFYTFRQSWGRSGEFFSVMFIF